MEINLPEVVYLQPMQHVSKFADGLIPAAAGALIGGLAVFSIEMYFRIREERRADLARDHALYLFINQIMYDVTSIHSKLHEVLGDKEWPVDIISKVPRMIGQSNHNTSLDPALLSTLKGPRSNGLVHDIFELRNSRDLIVQLHSALNVALEKLQNLMINHAESREKSRITSAISSDHPDFPVIDISRHEATDLAKSLIQMGDAFIKRMIVFGQKYNEFKSLPSKRLNANLVIDIHGLEKLISTNSE